LVGFAGVGGAASLVGFAGVGGAASLVGFAGIPDPFSGGTAKVREHRGHLIAFPVGITDALFRVVWHPGQV
jgi:hypothetical protein